MTQMLSWESAATPETWPSIQLFGRCFGQYGSGSYFGSDGAAASRPVTISPNKVIAARVCDLITDLQERPICRARIYYGRPRRASTISDTMLGFEHRD